MKAKFCLFKSHPLNFIDLITIGISIPMTQHPNIGTGPTFYVYLWCVRRLYRDIRNLQFNAGRQFWEVFLAIDTLGDSNRQRGVTWKFFGFAGKISWIEPEFHNMTRALSIMLCSCSVSTFTFFLNDPNLFVFIFYRRW